MEYEVGTTAEFRANAVKGVTAGEIELVLICAADGTISALRDRCSHANVRLSKGEVCNGEIVCPAHGARFDIKTGKNLCMPAVTPVKTYPVRIDGERVLVSVE